MYYLLVYYFYKKAKTYTYEKLFKDIISFHSRFNMIIIRLKLICLRKASFHTAAFEYLYWNSFIKLVIDLFNNNLRLQM